MGFEDTPNNYNPPDEPPIERIIPEHEIVIPQRIQSSRELAQVLKFSENRPESVPEFHEYVFEKPLLGEPTGPYTGIETLNARPIQRGTESLTTGVRLAEPRQAWREQYSLVHDQVLSYIKGEIDQATLQKMLELQGMSQGPTREALKKGGYTAVAHALHALEQSVFFEDTLHEVIKGYEEKRKAADIVIEEFANAFPAYQTTLDRFGQNKELYFASPHQPILKGPRRGQVPAIKIKGFSNPSSLYEGNETSQFDFTLGSLTLPTDEAEAIDFRFITPSNIPGRGAPQTNSWRYENNDDSVRAAMLAMAGELRLIEEFSSTL